MGSTPELVPVLLTGASALAATLLCVRAYVSPGAAASPDVRLLRAAVSFALALACLLVVNECVRGVASRWSVNRLAPALAFTRGINPYTTYEQGPQISWMYGPGAVLAYTPAALFSSPVASVVAAHVWTALLVWTPVLAICLMSCGAHRSWGRTPGLCAFALALLLAPPWRLSPLHEVTGRVIADAPALACSGWALFVLVFGPRRRQRLRLACTALLATLAVWTKQTTLPILLVLPVAVYITEGPVAALWLALYAALMNGLALALFSVPFGLDRLFFVMITHPLNWGWQAEVTFGQLNYEPLQGGLLQRLRVLLGVGHECTLLALPAVVVILLLSLRALSGDGGQSRGRGSPRAKRAASVAAALALGMLPLAMLARAKAGGYMNVHSSWCYFLTICVCVFVASHGAWDDANGLPGPRGRTTAYALLLALGTAVCMAVREHAALVLPLGAFAAATLMASRLRMPRKLTTRRTAAGLLFLAMLPLHWAYVGAVLVPRVRALGETPLGQASAYAERAPGSAWFPELPLVHLIHEGQLYHTRAGIWDRLHADHPVPPSLFHRHIPRQARIVAMQRTPGKPEMPTIEHGLGGLAPEGTWRKADIPDLPGFTCFRRVPSPPAGSKPD